MQWKVVGSAGGQGKREQVARAEGRVVARIEIGAGEVLRHCHRAEVMVIHFTDGSSLNVWTGSNASNLACEYPKLRPEEFHTDLIPLFQEIDA